MIDTLIVLFIIEHPLASALMLAAVLWWAMGWRLLLKREHLQRLARAVAQLFARRTIASDAQHAKSRPHQGFSGFIWFSKKEKATSRFALPLGAPGWKMWTFFGLPLEIVIDVVRDDEVGVYVATGRYIKGLVIESDSLDGIKLELEKALGDLLSVNHPQSNLKTANICLYTAHS